MLEAVVDDVESDEADLSEPPLGNESRASKSANSDAGMAASGKPTSETALVAFAEAINARGVTAELSNGS